MVLTSSSYNFNGAKDTSLWSKAFGACTFMCSKISWHCASAVLGLLTWCLIHPKLSTEKLYSFQWENKPAVVTEVLACGLAGHTDRKGARAWA